MADAQRSNGPPAERWKRHALRKAQSACEVSRVLGIKYRKRLQAAGKHGGDHVEGTPGDHHESEEQPDIRQRRVIVG